VRQPAEDAGCPIDPSLSPSFDWPLIIVGKGMVWPRAEDDPGAVG